MPFEQMPMQEAPRPKLDRLRKELEASESEMKAQYAKGAGKDVGMQLLREAQEEPADGKGTDQARRDGERDRVQKHMALRLAYKELNQAGGDTALALERLKQKVKDGDFVGEDEVLKKAIEALERP